MTKKSSMRGKVRSVFAAHRLQSKHSLQAEAENTETNATPVAPRVPPVGVAVAGDESSDPDLHEEANEFASQQSERRTQERSKDAARATSKTVFPQKKFTLKHPIVGECIDALQDGTCSFCGYTVEEWPWGRAACRGCSVVDAMDLTDHVFWPLLRSDVSMPSVQFDINRVTGYMEQEQSEAEKRRSAVGFTPPPFCDDTERIMKLFETDSRGLSTSPSNAKRKSQLDKLLDAFTHKPVHRK
jgi:hypothetical protein